MCLRRPASRLGDGWKKCDAAGSRILAGRTLHARRSHDLRHHGSGIPSRVGRDVRYLHLRCPQGPAGLSASRIATVDPGLHRPRPSNIAAIPRAQRNAAKAELATLTNHLQELYIGQSSLVRNLDFYVSIAKDKARTDEEKANYWKTVVLPKIGGIRRSISKVRDFIVRTDLVVMTMTAEDMMLLRDNLRTRAIVVEKMEELPPPVAAPDLLEVEGIIVDYKALVENLLKLRKSIEETLRKLDRG